MVMFPEVELVAFRVVTLAVSVIPWAALRVNKSEFTDPPLMVVPAVIEISSSLVTEVLMVMLPAVAVMVMSFVPLTPVSEATVPRTISPAVATTEIAPSLVSRLE